MNRYSRNLVILLDTVIRPKYLKTEKYLGLITQCVPYSNSYNSVTMIQLIEIYHLAMEEICALKGSVQD